MQKIVSRLAAGLVFLGALSAQETPPPAHPRVRAVTVRVAPVYPALARKMNVEGVVKIEAVVRPNGVVKSTRVVGGNPVLVDAAQDAVKQWKFEAEPSESTEVVSVFFKGR